MNASLEAVTADAIAQRSGTTGDSCIHHDREATIHRAAEAKLTCIFVAISASQARAWAHVQALFDFSSSTAPAWGKPSGLSELHVDGFDTEQIWGQLEASCGPALKQLRKKLKLLSSDFVLLDEETEAALDGEQIFLPLLIVQSRQ